MDHAQSKRKTKATRPLIVLASASPRRRDLLRFFFKLQVIPADADESQRRNEAPSKYVSRVARTKWEIVARQMNQARIVVAADTVVVLNGKIFGKPDSLAAAKKMLERLSGKEHEVLTAISVGWSDGRYRATHQTHRTKVSFRKISNDEMKDYLRSHEWAGKAGAYGIQGRALSFVARIQGSLTGVIGLPLKETLELIEKQYEKA